jgi:D-tyrosyl-tRNA(Tyr) deacylase
MKILIQRVAKASVAVRGQLVGKISRGLLVFIGLEKTDSIGTSIRAIEKLLAYRVFADKDGKMNRSITDIGGGILLVSQFTLAADTKNGLRPSFSSAMPPELAEVLYCEFLEELKSRHMPVEAGQFGADMEVSLVNDGPVTFMLDS